MQLEKSLQRATRKAIALMKKGQVSAYIQTLVLIDQIKKEMAAFNGNQVAHS